jgi:hypothetical protein
MDTTGVKKAIMMHILDRDDFERMKSINEGSKYDKMSYDDFLQWNRFKIDALDKEEISWLSMLIAYISSYEIKLVDMEDCGRWTASAFFYDMDANLCIVHPR